MKNKFYNCLMAICLVLVFNITAVYAQPAIENEFFEQVDYIGAFGDATGPRDGPTGHP